MIHYAKIKNSPRLQRMLAFLRDKRWHSTWSIIHGARVCNPNTGASELRANGYNIKCEYKKAHPKGYYHYRLVT